MPLYNTNFVARPAFLPVTAVDSSVIFSTGEYSSENATLGSNNQGAVEP